MKLKNILNRIPRPLKACVCATLAVLLAIAYYIALGCPTLFFRQEFRRAEKANLVGRSTIVDTMNDEYNEFDKMIVGETEEGVCFFGRYYNHHPYGGLTAEKKYLFAYVRKTGDITIAAAPNVRGLHWTGFSLEQSVPVYLFVEKPEAVRAEVELRIAKYVNNQTAQNAKEQIFHAEATRSDGECFKFWLSASDEAGLTALFGLSCNTGYRAKAGDYAISATVRLYDASGVLIQEKEFVISAK